jgi:polygalacturonase
MRESALLGRIAGTGQHVQIVLTNWFRKLTRSVAYCASKPEQVLVLGAIGQPEAKRSQSSHFRGAWMIALLVLAVAAEIPGQCAARAVGATASAQSMVWNAPLYRAILKKIHAPIFPDRDFNVLKFGASADGKTDCAPAFNHAIQACHAAGGGTVIVPKGTYECNGPITLLSNVNFHLDGGSQINFGFNPTDYLTGKAAVKGCVLVRYEGVWCYNYSPLIYAMGKHNVAVTGQGVFNGQRNDPHSTWIHWYNSQEKLKWKDRLVNWAYSDHLTAMRKRVFGAGWHLMPEFCDFEKCRNILVRGVTFTNTPFWTIHPCFSRNVIIEGVTVYNHVKNMDDGIDVDSCDDTLIQNCCIRNDDDNIVIKSGRNADAWSVNGGRPSENIIIRHNWLSHDIGFGSEMSGGIKNVFELDNEFGNSANIIYMKWGGERGGYIKHIYIRGITADSVRCLTQPAIAWAGGYALPNAGFVPEISDWAISDVHINRVESTGSTAIGLVNLDPSPIENVILRNITIGSVAAKAPAVWLKNARNIHFQNVIIAGHVIKPLHVAARWHGRKVILTWTPYPNAARYILYIGRKKTVQVKGGNSDRFTLNIPDNKKPGGYIGLGAVSANGMVVMRQDVKWPVQSLPNMKHLSSLLTRARAMLQHAVKPVPVVPMHYTPRQRAISHLYYCVHAAELVLGNSTATSANVTAVEEMLSHAMRSLSQ